MHSRIKEIADKVWSLDTEPNPHFEICLQAFAELIVQECLKNMENCDGDLDFATWKTKQDFGIEDELKD